jgi:hypothetical protein
MKKRRWTAQQGSQLQIPPKLVNKAGVLEKNPRERVIG